MALTQRLDLRQSQTLVMTPQLQQAIRLLQLSSVELTAFVEQELERNPLLERDEAEAAPTAAEAFGEPPEDGAAQPASDSVGVDRLTGSEVMAGDGDAPLDADLGNVWNDTGPTDGPADPASDMALDGAAAWGSPHRPSDDDDAAGWEQRATRAPTLSEHLQSQIQMDLADPGDRLIAGRLVDLLDDTGYLTADLAALAEELGCSVERIESVLQRVQRLEPPGLFARSLAECLALQLADRNRLDPAMQALLDNLDLLAAGDLERLLPLCGIDMPDLIDMIAEIRALDPKPGLSFGGETAQTVVPDVLMRPSPSGGWAVELNTETLPRVLVNHRFYTDVSAAATAKADKDFITDCYASASWLVKSLHQRATTILKVAAEIVRQQEMFFQKGIQHLKPLILRDIAEAIGMHESTVSRVTSNKFIATPRGILELKYFFTAAIQGADGAAAHSAESVRHRIKVLIDDESPTDVLSDDRIVEILRADGIDIARRTVAKYREALRIPSSVQRRRLKSVKALAS